MRDFVLKRIVAVIIPFISLYGFYVILHGAISPGSFAGGIIVALSVIAFATIFGLEKAKEKLPEKILVWTESYGTPGMSMGLVGIVKGVPFLSNRLAGINLGCRGPFLPAV